MWKKVADSEIWGMLELTRQERGFCKGNGERWWERQESQRCAFGARELQEVGDTTQNSEAPMDFVQKLL